LEGDLCLICDQFKRLEKVECAFDMKSANVLRMEINVPVSSIKRPLIAIRDYRYLEFPFHEELSSQNKNMF
jgi:hypothetical protein